MKLWVNIDDSADGTAERAVVAGAFVGFYHQWSKLRDAWRKRLKRDGVEYFHTTDLYMLDGPFRVYRDKNKYPPPAGKEAADSLLNDLEEIIHRTQVMGVAVCIDMKAYREIRNTEPHADKILPQDAFKMALQTLCGLCAEIVRDNFPDKPSVEFLFDDSSSSSQLVEAYHDYKKDYPRLAAFMGQLKPMDDRKFVPLQAADLMAHLSKNRFVDWLSDPERKQFTPDEGLGLRLKKLNVHTIAVCDKGYIMAMVKDRRPKL